MMKNKKRFKNLDELYNFTGYFLKYNRYIDYIKLIHTSSKPYLYNQISQEKVSGLQNINKYLKLKNINIEI